MDFQVLGRIKFHQVSEWKNWQGVNSECCGVPGKIKMDKYIGTAALSFKEGVKMF